MGMYVCVLFSFCLIFLRPVPLFVNKKACETWNFGMDSFSLADYVSGVVVNVVV